MLAVHETFKALSDETRMRIIRLLVEVDSAVCVCELVDALEIPQYRVSRHLAVLKRAGLMQVTKQGTWSYYILDRSDLSLSALWEFLRTAPMDVKALEQLRRDQAALELRFQLRENGTCVIGLRSGEPEKSAGSLNPEYQE